MLDYDNDNDNGNDNDNDHECCRGCATESFRLFLIRSTEDARQKGDFPMLG